MSAPGASVRAGAEQAFLAALADAERRKIPLRTALVVAHPDDETIGCGSLLARIADLTIVHVTDGAPKNGEDAARHGFTSPAGYAAARRRELDSAVALAGISRDRLLSLGWSDQEASLHLAETAGDLAHRLAGMDVVLTHAFEGGHPDHDATAFAVHAACCLMGCGTDAPAIMEVPLYRAGPDGWAVQSFAPDGLAETVLALNPDEARRKRAMLDAFETQREVLVRFSSTTERYRPAPDYDFAELPNGGNLLYENQRWGMTGARWLELARAALAELGLGRHA